MYRISLPRHPLFADALEGEEGAAPPTGVRPAARARARLVCPSVPLSVYASIRLSLSLSLSLPPSLHTYITMSHGVIYNTHIHLMYKYREPRFTRAASYHSFKELGRCSKPRAIAYMELKMPFEGSKLQGLAPFLDGNFEKWPQGC